MRPETARDVIASLWLICALWVLCIAAFHGRRWRRRRRTQDAPRPHAAHANEGPVSLRREYRSTRHGRAS
jgi:hypothetical protein